MAAQGTKKGTRPWAGQSLPRFEDLRLLSGAGRYTDDINLPGQAYAAFLRSPHAHARIIRTDAARALETPARPPFTL